MVAHMQTTSYTVEEAASFLNRAPWFVAAAVGKGELVLDAEGRLSRAALLSFIEEKAQRDAALREVMAVSEDSGLYSPDTLERLIELGIVDSELA